MFSTRRVNPKREFFRIPLKEAIKALQQIAQRYQVTSNPPADYAASQATEILPRLRNLYPQYLRPEITSVKIVQKEDVCFIEITSRVHENLRDEKIERIDLEFISEGDLPMFDANRSTRENADKFVNELDAYSIIVCTTLFTEEASKAIAAEFERNRPPR